MSEMKPELESDLSINSNADPKNMQELTIYVSGRSRPLAEHIIIEMAVLGPGSVAECPGQVPEHVRPDYYTYRRHGQSDR